MRHWSGFATKRLNDNNKIIKIKSINQKKKKLPPDIYKFSLSIILGIPTYMYELYVTYKLVTLSTHRNFEGGLIQYYTPDNLLQLFIFVLLFNSCSIFMLYSRLMPVFYLYFIFFRFFFRVRVDAHCTYVVNSTCMLKCLPICTIMLY